MIDSHCHLEFQDFDEDRDKVIEKSKKVLKALVDSSAEIEKSEEVLNLHEKHPKFIFPSLGLHPTEAIKSSRKEIEEHKKKIRRHVDEIVAIGEVGLEYNHQKSEEKEKSKNVFREFIELSNDLDLPLVIHSRNAIKDTLEILKEKDGTTIIHCFAGNREEMKEALDRGYYLSFGGIIFRMEDKYRSLLEDVPLENILLETDAPFLARKKKDRSEPSFIKEVAERISNIKRVDFSKLWKTTGQNAVEAFDLPVEL